MTCSANIVYANTWLAQTSNLGPISLLTIAATGMYRVNISGNLASSGFNPTANVSDTIGGSNISVGIGSYILSQPQCVEWLSGTTIDLSVSGYSGTAYDLFVVIEQLA